MKKPIKLDLKKPFVVSSTKNGLTVGKWMVNYLIPKKSFLEEELQQNKKQIKKFGKDWKAIKEAHLENSPGGTEILIEFYKQAKNYSETYWKICVHKQKQKKGNPKKLAKDIKNAEKDFNYFSNQYIKYKKQKRQSKETPTSKKLDIAIEEVNKSRDEVLRAQKEYGEKSWHAKRALLTHLKNISSFIQIDSANKRKLLELFPNQKAFLIPELNKLENLFKNNQNKIAFIKDTL